MVARSDEEQVEVLKKWWDENGRAVIFGVIIGIGGLAGWNGWQNYKESRAETASDHYAALREAAGNDQQDKVADEAAKLRDAYAATPYAALGALELARLKAEVGELDAAEEQLRWASENASQQVVGYVAAVRLARVLVGLGKLDEALAIVEREFPTGYASLLDEIKGDVFRARGDVDEARAAYNRAITTATGDIDYLRMKRDDLGEAKTTSPDQSS
ncbi:MAG: YfgM family protein [Gammaproteobacteria bacterium]